MERSTTEWSQIRARPKPKSLGSWTDAVKPTARQSALAEHSHEELGDKRKTPLTDRIAHAGEQHGVQPTVDAFRIALVERKPVEEEEHSDLKSLAQRLASLLQGAVADLAWRVS